MQKHAIVTGANRGIGLEVTRQLLERGFHVHRLCRSRPSDDLAHTTLWQVDLRDLPALRELMAALPCPEVLVNNAGTMNPFGIGDYTDERREQILQVNLIAAVELSAYFGAKMAERGSGRVISLGSIAGGTVRVDLVAAETVELNHQALATRKDFDLDEATRLTELAALAAVAKDRGSSAYRAAFPHGLSWLVGLRGKAQENANHELVAVLRQRLPELGEKFGTQLEQLAKSATAAEDAWRAAERAAKTALVEEQIARSELVRQLHSNRGALRALYPRNPRRVASYFPPSYSRVAGEPDAVDTDEAQAEASAG